MRKLRTLAIAGALALVLAGCSDDDDDECWMDDGCPPFVFQTLSRQQADGGIEFSPSAPPGSQYTIYQADETDSVLFAVYPDGTESRAFLDFPLDGSDGGDVLPPEAEIVWAGIEVFVIDVELASEVQSLLDVVPFPITGLREMNFNSDYLATAPFDFYASDISDIGYIDIPIPIDVTPLMEEAQRRGLPDLQLRFLLDFIEGAVGLVELYDGIDGNYAPLLTVEYQ